MISAEKTPEQLVREDLERQVLEAAAKALERQIVGSRPYQYAFKKAARIVRSLKP